MSAADDSRAGGRASSGAGPERPGPQGRERARMSDFELLPITPDTSEAEAIAVVKEWTASAIPAEWQEAVARGGHAELRKVRPRADYEVWYPNLAPSDATVKLGLAAQTPAQWKRFVKAYHAEMAAPEAARTIEMLALLSRHASFSVGCYCEDESRCHRSLLRALLAKQGARIA